MKSHPAMATSTPEASDRLVARRTPLRPILFRVLNHRTVTCFANLHLLPSLFFAHCPSREPEDRSMLPRYLNLRSTLYTPTEGVCPPKIKESKQSQHFSTWKCRTIESAKSDTSILPLTHTSRKDTYLEKEQYRRKKKMRFWFFPISPSSSSISFFCLFASHDGVVFSRVYSILIPRSVQVITPTPSLLPS